MEKVSCFACNFFFLAVDDGRGLAGAALAEGCGRMKVHVYNVADGETLPYSLPLVIGDVECLHEDSTIRVWLSHDPQAVLQWPVVAGCFKILVQLRPGQNVVNIRHDNDVLQLHLTYERPPLAHFVRPVYIVCADDDGYFQGPEDMDCSPESAMRRIVLGAQLIQSFTAEKMVEHGFGRLTFQLETGQDGARPVCHLFRTKLTLEQAYAMSGYDLWNHFAKELMTSNFPSRSKCKWYCFMSFTRYQPPPEEEIPKTHSEILKYTKGHTALGKKRFFSFCPPFFSFCQVFCQWMPVKSFG